MERIRLYEAKQSKPIETIDLFALQSKATSSIMEELYSAMSKIGKDHEFLISLEALFKENEWVSKICIEGLVDGFFEPRKEYSENGYEALTLKDIQSICKGKYSGPVKVTETEKGFLITMEG